MQEALDLLTIGHGVDIELFRWLATLGLNNDEGTFLANHKVGYLRIHEGWNLSKWLRFLRFRVAKLLVSDSEIFGSANTNRVQNFLALFIFEENQ